MVPGELLPKSSKLLHIPRCFRIILSLSCVIPCTFDNTNYSKTSICTDMYIFKIKGKVKIPDYVQIRDDNFTLLAYFRSDRPERALAKCGLADKEAEIRKVIEELPYGQIKKLKL